MSIDSCCSGRGGCCVGVGGGATRNPGDEMPGVAWQVGV